MYEGPILINNIKTFIFCLPISDKKEIKKKIFPRAPPPWNDPDIFKNQKTYFVFGHA